VQVKGGRSGRRRTGAVATVVLLLILAAFLSRKALGAG
jgi:hypothetical protein